jgi:muconate cycloisomerase
MKIVNVEAFPVSIPLKKPFKIALGTMTHSPGIPCFLGGCIETGVGTAAALHFAACAPNLFPAVELVGSSMFTDDIVKEPFFASRGAMPLPEKPGIGVEVDEEKLKCYSQL